MKQAFKIIDHLLPKSDFLSLWSSIQRLPFKVLGPEWKKGSQLTDPPQAASEAFLWSQKPVAGPLAELVERISLEIIHSDMFGSPPQDWSDIAFRVYLQGRGAKMIVHSDSPKYVGAGVFYAHPEWVAGWGGELYFPATIRSNESPDELLGDGPISLRSIKRRLAILGRGEYVSPSPNRLVLIGPGVLHGVSRIDSDAGDNLRCSVAAFLLHSRPAHDSFTIE